MTKVFAAYLCVRPCKIQPIGIVPSAVYMYNLLAVPSEVYMSNPPALAYPPPKNPWFPPESPLIVGGRWITITQHRKRM